MIRLSITDHLLLRDFPSTLIITSVLAVMSVGVPNLTPACFTVSVIQEARCPSVQKDKIK